MNKQTHTYTGDQMTRLCLHTKHTSSDSFWITVLVWRINNTYKLMKEYFKHQVYSKETNTNHDEIAPYVHNIIDDIIITRLYIDFRVCITDNIP